MEVAVSVGRFDIKVFEKMQRAFPEVRREYELNRDIYEEAIEEPFVSVRLEREDDTLTIDFSEYVTNGEFEVKESVSVVLGKPFVRLTFSLKDGGSLTIGFWNDSARKLIEFFKEAIDNIEKEANEAMGLTKP